MIRRNKIFFFFFVLLSFSGNALPDISMEVYRYQSPGSPYIEVSLYVAGPSLKCSENRADPYGISYILMIRDAEGNVVAGNRYRLIANGCPAKDIIDVKRFNLPPGRFAVELEASDILDTLDVVKASQEIEIEPDTAQFLLSDIQLLSTIRPEQRETPSLNKSGLYLEPLPFRFYYPALTQLFVYHETYHMDQLAGQPYMQYTIRPSDGDLPPPVQTYKKLKKEAINANIFQLDISGLISGPYILEANLFDGERNLKASARTTFSRLNPYGDSVYMEKAALVADLGFAMNLPADSLNYFLRAMAPVVNSFDVDVMNTLLDKGSDKAKRYYIHRYWTNSAGKHADFAFQSYMKVAIAVDHEFRSGFGYGFETDRGHIFLKYGKPDDIIAEETEPSAPPYEIWFYTQFPATHQNNVRFLFYNPSLVKNGFTLLHSTAIGEINNPRWEIELYRDATLETPGVNEKVMGENVHRNARRYFEN